MKITRQEQIAIAALMVSDSQKPTDRKTRLENARIAERLQIADYVSELSVGRGGLSVKDVGDLKAEIDVDLDADWVDRLVAFLDVSIPPALSAPIASFERRLLNAKTAEASKG